MNKELKLDLLSNNKVCFEQREQIYWLIEWLSNDIKRKIYLCPYEAVVAFNAKPPLKWTV